MTTEKTLLEASVIQAVRTTTAYVASRLPEGPENFDRIATCEADTPLLLEFVADALADLPVATEGITSRLLSAYLHASACAAWFSLFPADTTLQALSARHSERAGHLLRRIRALNRRPRRVPPI